MLSALQQHRHRPTGASAAHGLSPILARPIRLAPRPLASRPAARKPRVFAATLKGPVTPATPSATSAAASAAASAASPSAPSPSRPDPIICTRRHQLVQRNVGHGPACPAITPSPPDEAYGQGALDCRHAKDDTAGRVADMPRTHQSVLGGSYPCLQLSWHHSASSSACVHQSQISHP